MKVLTLLLFLLFLKHPVFSSDLDKEIETFILNNPEVILKSLENYELKKGKGGK